MVDVGGKCKVIHFNIITLCEERQSLRPTQASVAAALNTTNFQSSADEGEDETNIPFPRSTHRSPSLTSKFLATSTRTVLSKCAPYSRPTKAFFLIYLGRPTL